MKQKRQTSNAARPLIYKLQQMISDKIFKKYSFEIRSNKIFIMTKQVNEFDIIRPIRKGLLFAEIKGDKIIISEIVKTTLEIS